MEPIIRTDKQGRTYKHFVVQRLKTSVLCLGNSNLEYKGVFKIVERNGSSKFGEEVIFEFHIDHLEKEYDTDSKHNCFETYLTKAEAIELFESVLKELKQ